MWLMMVILLLGSHGFAATLLGVVDVLFLLWIGELD